MANPVEAVTARGGFAVTKSDTTVFTRIPSALYVGTAGDVTVRSEAGDSLVFQAVAGGIIPCRVDKVMSTGTTASFIVALCY